jgi:hypothetical protein
MIQAAKPEIRRRVFSPPSAFAAKGIGFLPKPQEYGVSL